MATSKWFGFRTSREVPGLILEELAAGRLRQGWGWLPDQDLRLLRKKDDSGKPFTDDERDAWRNWPMLGGPDGLAPGARLVLMNLPEPGRFLLAEVVGPYDYNRVRLEAKYDVDDLGEDFGHILPVRVPGGLAAGFSSSDKRISAAARRSFRCRSRIWSLEDYAADFDELWRLAEAGDVRDEHWTESDALSAVYQRTFEAVRERWQAEFTKQLHATFQSAEFESPCRELFQRMYPEAAVEKTAGRSERGADFLVTYDDPLAASGDHAGVSWVMVVQVKHWTETADELAPIDQIVDAARHYRNRGEIRAGVIVTMCDEEGTGFRKYREAKSKELGTPIHFIGERRLIDLFRMYGPSTGLGAEA